MQQALSRFDVLVFTLVTAAWVFWDPGERLALNHYPTWRAMLGWHLYSGAAGTGLIYAYLGSCIFLLRGMHQVVVFVVAFGPPTNALLLCFL